MSKTVFFVMANPPEKESHSVVEDLNACMCVAKNFKRAYEMALYLGGVKNPDVTYRQALTLYKDQGSVYIGEQGTAREEDDEGLVMISRLKLYG